ncbi:hypothetical protein N431DRAFT_434413 [Stipitochalara longipes BDJ]|nr:hypothetical protein N431DRAFT_434413 [Stipitochalara longipes BDJ]
MLKGVYEKDAKLRMAFRPATAFKPSIPSTKTQPTKPSMIAQNSQVQPKKQSYVSQGTQTTAVTTVSRATQTPSAKLVFQGAQTMEVASKSQAAHTKSSKTAILLGSYARVQSSAQVQRAKTAIVSSGTQTDEIPSAEMDHTVKGEKESDWEDMNLDKGGAGEDTDWEFVNF